MELNRIIENILQNCVSLKESQALVDSKITISYEIMYQQACCLATLLLKNVNDVQTVGLYMEKSVNYVVAIVGTMLSGHAYVPLDKSMGKERINYVLREANCGLVITDDPSLEVMLETYVYADEEIRNIVPTEHLPIVAEDDVAYIMFTSGTSGVPKGVMISYKNLWNLLASLHKYIYDTEIKRLQIGVVASFAFDASIKQIFYSLVYGHTLHILDDKTKRIKRLFMKYMELNQVDVCDITPALLNIMSRDKREYCYPKLKKILVGGEKMFGYHIDIIRRLFNPEIDIYNVYGPTECCVDTCIYKVLQTEVYGQEEVIPVGKVIDQGTITLTEEKEIVIGGNGVGLGYTSDNLGGYFVEKGERYYATGDIGSWDKYGNLIVKGRKDEQVKVNGYRIELQDIESNVCMLEGVEFAKCFVYENQIVCVVNGKECDEKWYQKELSNKISKFMVPSYFIINDIINVNKNMKFDKDFYVNVLKERLRGYGK